MKGDEHQIDPAEQRRRYASAWWVITIAVLLATGVVAAKLVHAAEVQATEKKAVRNLHMLQLKIEEYRVEHGEYPPSPLVDSRWYEPFMLNPYTEELVRLVPFAERSPGEITYIHIPPGTYGNQRVNGSYYLLTYCGEDKLGYDISGDRKADGVLLVLESGWDNLPRQFPDTLDTVWKAIQWAEGVEE